MRKYLCVFVVLIFLLTVPVSCAAEEPQEKCVAVEIEGQAAVVLFEPGTLSVGMVQTDKGMYAFAWNQKGELKITYPDNTQFTYTKNGSGMSSVDFNPESKGYISGLALAWGIEGAIDDAQPQKDGDGGYALLGIFLLAVGAWNTFAPRMAWYFSYGWRFRNAEPSDAALAFQGVGGVVFLLAGGVCLLTAIF